MTKHFSLGMNWYFERSNSKISGDILEFLIKLNYITLIYFAPIFSLIGICANIFILKIMIINEATIKIRPRMYFISFALGDLGSIILWNCKEFIVTGLWITSSGGFNIPLYSPGMCKLVVGLFHLFAILAIYSIIAMNCDLVMALYWPLKHKIFMTPQRSSYLLLSFVALTWAIQIPLTLLTTTSIKIPTLPFPICSGDTRNPLYPFYIILTLFLLQGFHPAFLGFLSVLIISKLN